MLFAATSITVGLLAVARAYGPRAADWVAFALAVFGLGRAWLRARRGYQQLQQAYVRSLEDKHDFIATISHEFRTPLTAIVGFSQLLSDEARPIDAERRRYYLKFLTEQSQHLARMIEDTVDLSRADEGQLLLHPTTIALYRVIESALALLGLPEASARVQVSVAPDTPHVWADPGELEQALDRLFHIVLAASEADVLVEVEPAGERGARVTLHAAGLAAESEALAPLTGDTSLWRQSERYMGAAAARAIVQLHGGRVWVEPRAQETAIRFELPAARPEPEPASPLRTQALAKAPETAQQPVAVPNP